MANSNHNSDTSNQTRTPQPTDAAQALATQLAKLELLQQEIRLALSEMRAPAQLRVVRPADPQGAILDALKQHGKRTTQQLEKDCGLTKPQVHYHVGVLEQQGKAVTVRGVRNDAGRRGPDVVYTADALAV